MMLNRRHFLGGAGALAGAAGLPFSSGCAAAAVGALTPEQFGARGDGVTNDTEAFSRLAAQVNRQGGGEIVLRRATYIVGRQQQARRSGGAYAFEPVPILDLRGLSRPLLIRGNGARLRCAPGLRYGTFDPRSGARTNNRMPFFGQEQLATPYQAMVWIADGSGAVEINDLELDGNLRALAIGGPYGDTGRQIPAFGLGLVNLRGPVTVRRVNTHHHALDGLLVDGPARAEGGRFEELRCEYNGRQGCSIVGGGNYAFHRCHFSHTGKAGLASAPGAGVDIEAEGGKQVRGLSFSECTFANNSGAGMVADSGPSQDVRFTGCNFVGTTSWAVWPNKPGFSFRGCTFVGAITRCHGDAARPDWAAQFIDCAFGDDPALSPTGEVYGGANPDRPIADLPTSPNVRFARCRFRLTHQAVLPWTTNVTIFEDCVMSQRSRTASYPRGTFVGRNRIDGNAVLYSAINNGELIVNGRAMPRGPVG